MLMMREGTRSLLHSPLLFTLLDYTIEIPHYITFLIIPRRRKYSIKDG